MANFLKYFWMSIKFCSLCNSVYSINAVTEDVYNPTVTFGESLFEIMYGNLHIFPPPTLIFDLEI